MYGMIPGVGTHRDDGDHKHEDAHAGFTQTLFYFMGRTTSLWG